MSNALDDYRAGYRAGYYAGRLAAMNGEPYDDRTAGEKAAKNNDILTNIDEEGAR